MKITIEFDDPVEARDALSVPDILANLEGFTQWLRAEIKYKETPADAVEIREKFWEILGDYISR